MNTSATAAADAAGHVEAFRSTGTSPGRSSSTIVTIPRDGEPIHARVNFEEHGPVRAHPVVVLGGISAGRHLGPTTVDPTPGWWPGVIGPDAPLNPRDRRLIGIDYLGGSQSPVEEGHLVSTEDQAHVVAGVLDHLGVQKASIIGASYGGMVALAFASLYPDRAANLVVLCAAHRTHPMATALRSVQRRIVRFGQQEGRGAEGVALARSLAMTTYRSAEEFEARFDSRPDHEGGDRPASDRLPGRARRRPVSPAPRFPVESYLEARGDHFASTVDGSAYLTLSTSVDTHRVEPETIVSSTTLISFDTDTLVPPWLVAELANLAPGVRQHVEVRSRFGHDAFLKEVDVVGAVLATVLQRPGAER